MYRVDPKHVDQAHVDRFLLPALCRSPFAEIDRLAQFPKLAIAQQRGV